MKPFGRFALFALLLPAAALAGGYLNAWAALDACADQAYREGREREGHDMKLRPLPLRRDRVSARIVAPFVVEASYLLPRGLHGTVYSRTYFVFAGHRRVLEAHVVPLVDNEPRRPHAVGALARG